MKTALKPLSDLLGIVFLIMFLFSLITFMENKIYLWVLPVIGLISLILAILSPNKKSDFAIQLIVGIVLAVYLINIL